MGNTFLIAGTMDYELVSGCHREFLLRRVASELSLREVAVSQWVEERGGIFPMAPCKQRRFGEARAGGESCGEVGLQREMRQELARSQESFPDPRGSSPSSMNHRCHVPT